MPNTPKMEAAHYPWLLTLTREVCEALTRPARERFGEKLREWYETRAPQPDDSAYDFMDDNPEPTASRYFLPTTGTLTLADKYARVAAIHDAVCECCEEINPWPVTDLETAPFEDAARCMAFTVLKGWATPRDLPDTPDVRKKVTGIWSDVRDDLTPSAFRLLGALADADERGRALAELPRELLDPKLLHDCDALGWIEFGNRDSIFLNTEHGKRRELGTGWRFGRRTIPGYKPMHDIIDEALRDEAEDPDVKAYPDLRTHVRVTAAGRTELARLRMNLAASVQPATAGAARSEAAGNGAGNNGGEAGAKGAGNPRRHSPDFRSVHWDGVDYAFTANQAAIVKQLWEAYENGTPDVGGDTLLVNAESDTRRMADVFKKHSAWGTMIVEGSTKGTYRLAPDPA
ncbi:MAG: hypothetical protein EDS66_12215 [Planctomycetota bacterium]|nr:MAG: hypothetical protein EDS66_12215 [Planctomycetota bacterium]